MKYISLTNLPISHPCCCDAVLMHKVLAQLITVDFTPLDGCSSAYVLLKPPNQETSH